MRSEECEICGAKVMQTNTVLVAGAEMNVCERCSKNYGKIVPKVHSIKKMAPVEKPEKYIVPDYALRIKAGRERVNMSLIMLARNANEKSSFLERIEAGKAKPDLKLAEKIEKILKITLIKEEVVEKVDSGVKKSGEMTLGDVIVVKKFKR